MLLIIALQCCARPLLAAGSPEVVSLSLKPHICVLAKNETQCQDQLIAEWMSTSRQELSLCLYQENNKQALACWKDAHLGRAEFSLALSETTAFELRTSSDQALVAREFFKVIYAQKKFTRRNPWSFF